MYYAKNKKRQTFPIDGKKMVMQEDEERGQRYPVTS